MGKFKIFNLLSCFFILISVSCKNKKNQLIIEPLYPYTLRSAWNGNPKDSFINKIFYISCFTSYDKDSSVLDNFVKAHIDSNYADYYSYQIFFYQEDNQINKNFAGSGSDLVCVRPLITYLWEKGKFSYCMDFSKPGGLCYPKKGSKLFNSTIMDSNLKGEIKVSDVHLEIDSEIYKKK